MQTTDEPAGPEDAKGMRSPPAIVPLLLAGLFMVTGICVLLLIGKEKTRIIGQTITELDIQPLINTESPLTDESMRGKVVVLHFWGYWSPACVKELPAFVKIQKSYASDADVLFANVSCSQRKEETLDALKFYTNKFMQHAEGKNSRPIMTLSSFSHSPQSTLDGWRLQLSNDACDQWCRRSCRCMANRSTTNRIGQCDRKRETSQ